MSEDVTTVARRALILAAGRGSRMSRADPAARLTTPQRRAAALGLKGLMPVAGLPLLEHAARRLEAAGMESLALVIPPSGDDLRRWAQGRPTPIEIVEQEEPRGTADAVCRGEEFADGEPFLVVNSDNLYPTEALRTLAAATPQAVVVVERRRAIEEGWFDAARLADFALVELGGDGVVRSIVEKPGLETLLDAPDPAYSSVNAWRFESPIFEHCRAIGPSPRGEYELPDAVARAMAHGEVFRVVPTTGIVADLSTRSDVARVERQLSGDL